MEPNNETIGARLKRARLAKNLTIPQVSEKTGISKGNLSIIENDKTKPSADALTLLSDLYGVSVDWILKGETKNQAEEGSNSPPPTTYTIKEFKFFMKELESVWEKGDPETKGWIVVQLRKAFPEVEEKIKREQSK